MSTRLERFEKNGAAKHLVLEDNDPKVLAQLTCLIKGGDKVTQLTCKKNALAAEVQKRDDLAYLKMERTKRDGTQGNRKRPW